jgi:hypothetical protein
VRLDRLCQLFYSFFRRYFLLLQVLILLLLVGTLSTQSALASVSASYLYAPQASSDPGDE